MPETSSPAGAENTGNQAAVTEASGAPTNADTNTAGASQQEQPKPQSNATIPKARFDEVIAQRKELEAKIAEFEAAEEERRQASLSEEEKRKERLASLEGYEAKYKDLEAKLASEQERFNGMAKRYIDNLGEETQEKVKAYAKAKGIAEDDVRGLYDEAIALVEAGLLNTATAKPQPPATHAGRPRNAGNPAVDPSTPEGARARLKQLLTG